MGKLIIVEGTDGSGKQTQTELLCKKLKEIKGEGKVKKYLSQIMKARLQSL